MIGFSLILACTIDGGIGNNNAIPWHIKDDLQLFQRITSYVDPSPNLYKKNAVIMGRKTWDSIQCKPLKNRLNIIISRNSQDINLQQHNNILIFSSLDTALQYCSSDISINHVFVIGGKSIYDLCLFNPVYSQYLQYIHLSIIPKRYICDTFIDFKKIIKLYKNYNIFDITFNNDFIYIKLMNNQSYL